MYKDVGGKMGQKGIDPCFTGNDFKGIEFNGRENF